MEHKPKNKDFFDRYDYLVNAASMHEATGLIPANPSPDDMEAYEELFRFEPPKIKPNQN